MTLLSSDALKIGPCKVNRKGEQTIELHMLILIIAVNPVRFLSWQCE